MSDVRAGLVIAGRYRLDVLIGEGGMATVWRGTDLSLSRDVAVKVLREDIAAQADAVSRFRREAHSAAKLNHPNVVQIYDTGVDGQVHYIVMEFLPEPDLKKIIHDWAPLPQAKVTDIAIQCCRALAYAHRNGIIHRDVKPHNILFTNEGRVKLSDFGIAAAAGGGSVDPGGVVLGSAHYIAPEQVQGSPAGPHSDLYSLGCVLYEALTHRTPFDGDSEAEIAARHTRERPASLRSINPNVSPSVEFVVSKAMAREVGQRYRSAEEMLTDLTKLSGGEDLDRTGVLSSPGGPTTVLQPTPSEADQPAELPGRAAPAPTSAPTQASRAPETPATPASAPVLRPEPKSASSPWGPVFAVVIAVIALSLVGALVKMAFYPGEAGKKVQVPMVKGETLSAARAILEENDLQVGEITFEENSLLDEGAVIHQSPGEGQTVEAGTRIDLVVNRGTELVMVVSVVGRTVDEANEILEKAGLSLGEVTERYHATVPAGIVTKQRIEPPAPAEKGTGIDVIVSKGPEPETTVTPPEPTDDGGPPVVVEPEVQLVQDDSYSSGNPAERKYIVTVTVQGQELGQHIQVVYQDDRGSRVVQLSKKLDPNETEEIPVITQGAAIIEVIHNGRAVYRQDLPAPTITAPRATTPAPPHDGPEGD